jgi:transcriptional regulator of met regulon
MPLYAGKIRFASRILACMDVLQQLRHNRARERANDKLREALIAERNQLIAQAFAEGHTGPEVGRAAGMSKERAYQLRDARR